MKKNYIQIGTNDGNDNFKNIVLKDKPDFIILVEPNSNLINDIKKNYNGIENVYIYNNAVYYNNNEDVELFIAAKDGIIGKKADNGILYSDLHFSLLPMNDWGEKKDMVKIKSKSITFDEICKKHNIINIDYLQIDTEGFDSEIIEMIDLTKYNIKKIRFEKWGFDTKCFTKYSEDLSYRLGINGMNNAKKKLISHGYKLTDISDIDGNDIIATLE